MWRMQKKLDKVNIQKDETNFEIDNCSVDKCDQSIAVHCNRHPKEDQSFGNTAENSSRKMDKLQLNVERITSTEYEATSGDDNSNSNKLFSVPNTQKTEKDEKVQRVVVYLTGYDTALGKRFLLFKALSSNDL